MNDCDWVKPGAEVLVYSAGDTSFSSLRPVRTAVLRVAKLTFTVAEENEPRFELGTLREQGGAGKRWARTWRVLVPADSDQATKILAEHRRRQAVARANHACHTWIKDKTRDNRLAAIAALQAVED